MKKIIVSVILLLALCFNLFALASCSNSFQGDSNFVVPEEGFDTNTPVTITFYHTMGSKYRAVLDTYIAEFNRLYPNITVEHASVGDYDDVREQIKSDIVVGQPPNLVRC